MKQRRGLELLRHMVKQVESRQPGPLERLRFSCSIEIAHDIALELVELSQDHNGSTIKRRIERGESPLIPGDRVYGCTIVNVFKGPSERGLAWVSHG